MTGALRPPAGALRLSTGALRLGTRRSALALAQSELVAAAVRAHTGREVELVHVVTTGDRSNQAITQLGGTGVFVTALREALHRAEVDFAVHSLKDLPTAPDPLLALAAVPDREDPRDALVSPSGRGLADLGPGARVGTGSPRRAAQLRALGLGLDVVPIRGNVDTRIKMAIDGGVDAVVLAYAGLSRLDRLDSVVEVLEPAVMLPAPGQGALAIECRRDDHDLAAMLGAAVDHPDSRTAVAAERACLATLEAGCTAAVGALADVHDDTVELRALAAAPDGTAVRGLRRGPRADAAQIGRALAGDLLGGGAAALLGRQP